MRVELPIVSFISTVLVLIPLPWHWRARNASTIAVAFWLAACNITRGVNAITWAGNVMVQYEIWCDITTKLIIGANVGIPASILCICRRLAQVSSPCPTIAKAGDQRQRMKFEIGMCVVLPIAFMLLHYVVQGYRFTILEDFGCYPGIYMSVMALILIPIPPLILSMIGLVYGGIALRWLIHRRYQCYHPTMSEHGSLISGRYLRLIVLSVAEMTFATAMCLFILLGWLDNEILPWDSWETVHENWSQIPLATNDEIPEIVLAKTMVTWYVVPISSVMFFAFFGLGDQAMAEYKQIFAWIKSCVFRVKPRLAPVLPETTHDIGSTTDSTGGIAFDRSEAEAAVPRVDKASGIPLSEHISSRPLSSLLIEGQDRSQPKTLP